MSPAARIVSYHIRMSNCCDPLPDLPTGYKETLVRVRGETEVWTTQNWNFALQIHPHCGTGIFQVDCLQGCGGCRTKVRMGSNAKNAHFPELKQNFGGKWPHIGEPQL